MPAPRAPNSTGRVQTYLYRPFSRGPSLLTLIMSEEDKDKELPWLYRLEPVSAAVGKPDIEPGDAVYRLFKNTRNPFLRRALAPSPQKLEPTATELQSLFRLLVEQRRYRLGPSNDEEPFQRRSLEHPPPPPTARRRTPSASARRR